MAVRVSPAEEKDNEKAEKFSYRILNWKEYNRALIQRGSLTFWFEESVIAGWYHQKKTGKPGANNYYSDAAISCGLILREVFHLALRQTQGVVSSILALMGLPLDCPNYTTFGRRQKGLSLPLPRQRGKEPLHVVVDSTGLKVYGDGEWKVRTHGASKRRTWRKLHLAVDTATHEILSLILTTNARADKEVFGELMEAIEEPLEQISADGAYDTFPTYALARGKGARLVVPPQENAVLKDPEFLEGEPPLRDEHLRAIQSLGKPAWKIQEGYHRRSLVETAMFRLKTSFGGHLKNRNFDHQRTESLMKGIALNKMTQLGMPLSYQVF